MNDYNKNDSNNLTALDVLEIPDVHSQNKIENQKQNNIKINAIKIVTIGFILFIFLGYLVYLCKK